MSDKTEKQVEVIESKKSTEKPAEKPIQPPSQEEQVNLMELKVESETDALNLMAGFLQIAQRRGAYSLAEASKIMEAINKFEKTSVP
tara:strand:+ start:3530 stop:3790 length:261 start_codon:yes stop_codon:yes gene_type:complete